MTTIRPFLWFDNQLEDAINFYASLFGDSAIHEIHRLPEGRPGRSGEVTTATFRLAGQEFMGLNGGPHYQFSPAISFFVECESQEEVDYLWDHLVELGTPQQCGWLTDRFGLTWQIIPRLLGELLGDPDPEKSARVMQAMLGMVKIESSGLRQAYDGPSL